MNRPWPLVLMYWLPPLGWAAMIFYLSTLAASPRTPPWVLLHDKIVHAIMFGTLALLFLATFRRGHGLSIWISAFLACGLSALYGATDEIHQYFVPWRVADPLDWIADVLGASCVFLIAWLPRLISRWMHRDRDRLQVTI